MHPKRAKIDEALVNGTAIRDIAGQHALAKSAVDRHRAHVGAALKEAAARLEIDLGDDVMGQLKANNRDLWNALAEAKRAKSLPAYLQVTDRLQKGLALQSTLIERAAGASEGNTRYELSWLDQCARHPHSCGCPSNGSASPSMPAEQSSMVPVGTPRPH